MSVVTSEIGTFQTWRSSRCMSVIRVKRKSGWGAVRSEIDPERSWRVRHPGRFAHRGGLLPREARSCESGFALQLTVDSAI
jgi:hypothetical protein